MIINSTEFRYQSSSHSTKKHSESSIVDLDDDKQTLKTLEISTGKSAEKVSYKEEKKKQKRKKVKSSKKVQPQSYQEDPFPRLTLTLQISKIRIGETRNYLLYQNLASKFTCSSEFLRFNEQVDLIYKTGFEMRAQTNFADNFIVLGLIEKSSPNNVDETKLISQGIRPRRGDFVGVYVNRFSRLVTFQVNRFVLDRKPITDSIINKVLNPFLFIQKPGGVMRINFCLEDQFK